ncbi:MAG: prephenate dehydrogenase [Chloroflexota bacterium]
MRAKSSIAQNHPKTVIAILGLGQIGASMGLALAGHASAVQRIGCDVQPAVANRARQIGAIDALKPNAAAAVPDADLVVLALPFDQIRAVLESIAPRLKPGAVVVDTAPAKETVAAWARQLLPDGRYHVGLAPVLTPEALQSYELGIEAAHTDLFRSTTLWIVAPIDAPARAVDMACALARWLGAEHVFGDAAEVDGLMALTHLLPQLSAAALLQSTANRPGWHDAGRLAGRAYAQATHPIEASEPAALAGALLANPQNVERNLNNLIAGLQTLRNLVRENRAEALIETLAQAQQGHLDWWQRRSINSNDTPAAEIPAASDFWKQILGGRLKK